VASALAGCGKITGPSDLINIDAPVTPQDAPEREIDAPDASLSGTVHFITQSHVSNSLALAAVANVPVFAYLPNGTMIGSGSSDGSGSASLAIYPGGSVLAAYAHNLDVGYDFVSYYAVQDGDTLTLGQHTTLNTPAALATVTLEYGTVSGATSYDFYNACGYLGSSGTTVASVVINQNCAPAPVTVFMEAYSPTVGEYYTASVQVTTLTTGSTFFAGAFTPEYPATGTATMNLAGIPSEVASAYGEFLSVSSTDGYEWESAATPQVVLTNGSGSGTTTFAYGGGRTIAETILQRPGAYYGMDVFDGLPVSATTSYTVASPPLPPWLSTSIASSAPDGQVAWFPVKTATTVDANGIVLRLRWSHAVTMGGPSIPFSWTIVLPPDATSYKVPTLPSAFASAQPLVSDSFSTNVDYFTIPSITNGYDGFRQVPEREIIGNSTGAVYGAFTHMIVSGN
jgi:hypothetical protein